MRSAFLLPIGVAAIFAAATLAGCVGGTDGDEAGSGLRPLALPKLSFTEVAGGLMNPVFVTHAGDGSGRLFIAEQRGMVWVWEDGKRLEEPFLNATHLTVAQGEQGFFSIAFDPKFGENGRVYASYTDLEGNSIVARYEIDPADPNRLDPESAVQVLRVVQPYEDHNGGLIVFGPDGYLWMSLGDGGSIGDPHNNAQNLDRLLGKILRIDVSGEDEYEIPPDNPFAKGGRGRGEVWSYGLRNPWRFSFDRETGDLYIGDVGQHAIEEINFEPAPLKGGVNYGWSAWEGRDRYQASRTALKPEYPVAQYTHDEGCSVTGGSVYRGKEISGLEGIYLFGDFCTGALWGLKREGGDWALGRFNKTPFMISSFGEDEAGELYLVDYGGTVQRITAG
jgi:glucose/arabinose dehydrogenase